MAPDVLEDVLEDGLGDEINNYFVTGSPTVTLNCDGGHTTC